MPGKPGNEPGGGMNGGKPGGGALSPAGDIMPGGPAMNGGGPPANGLNGGMATGDGLAASGDSFMLDELVASESSFLFCSCFNQSQETSTLIRLLQI